MGLRFVVAVAGAGVSVVCAAASVAGCAGAPPTRLVVVPKVVGDDPLQAEAVLAADGLRAKVVRLGQGTPADYPFGRVVLQDPAAGSFAEPGSVVQVNVF